jgi:FkbM family methyltransferase
LPEQKTLILDANLSSNLTRVLFWEGVKGFEYQELPIFIALAKISSCFFDIGANIGYYALISKIYNSKIEVHGFEPLPGAKNYFQKNVNLNRLQNIKVNEIAICDVNGVSIFYSNINPKYKHLTEHLYGDNSLDEKHSANWNRITFEVKTQRLDDYVNQNLNSSLKIDLMKLDTEGTEHLVLKGASNVLKNHRPIIMCEIIKNAIEKEISEILLFNNYSFYRIGNSKLKKSNTIVIEDTKETYFFVPEEKQNLISNLV